MSARNKAKINAIEDYTTALKTYRKAEFQKALELFTQVLDKIPGDGPSKLYIERCHQFIKDPPPADWDGVYTMTTK